MNRAEFQKLNSNEKQDAMLKISAAYPQFKFLNLSKFTCGEHSFETGIFDFEGSEFVFIPGDEPELGWDDFAVLDEISAKEIKEQCDYCPEDQSLREFVAEQTSPLRRTKIPAMLAERKPAELSWYEVDLSDERLKIYANEIEDFSRGKDKDISEMTVCGAIKLVREDGKIRALLFEDVTHEELEANLRKNGFSLPSQDEWEYLAGCGARTLWRFGDEPDPDKVALPHVNQPESPKFSLFEPNLFGLFIAFDPYSVELVSEPIYFKGGDGGSAFCGGASLFECLLPVSPFYAMSEEMRNDYLEFLDDGDIDNAIYRRIFRL